MESQEFSIQPEEQEWLAAHDDWMIVGIDFQKALRNVAHNYGGEELADRVYGLSVFVNHDPDNPNNASFPSADGLKLLESLHPGSGNEVFDEFESIDRARRERELKEASKEPTHKHIFRIIKTLRTHPNN